MIGQWIGSPSGLCSISCDQGMEAGSVIRSRERDENAIELLDIYMYLSAAQ